MIPFLKALYLTKRFFYGIAVIAVLFLISYWWHPLYAITWGIVSLGILCVLGDVAAIFSGQLFRAKRVLPDKFSNSDFNTVILKLHNNYSWKMHVQIIDELPMQFQKRDFLLNTQINPKDKSQLDYALRPVERGEYVFGRLNCYLSTKLGLVQRRYQFQDQQLVKVYPSFIQMRKYDFLALSNRLSGIGFKKVRRLGHTMEFEQIKTYVRGDDVRTVNWKATAKHARLMVNQYQDEKAQPIYSIINTGRVMKMPFEGVKLLDYAINSSLAFSNIALKKQDKVGVLTYAHKIGTFLPAQRKNRHLTRILETLYNINTSFLDSDSRILYAQIKRQITQRSLLFLYTNFEHIAAVDRQLPYLKAIAKQHLLVVVFFENTELKALVEQPVDNLSAIYDQTIARQFKADKQQILLKLRQNGLQAILTTPQNLTVNTINKYLELKSRGLL